MYVLEFPDDRVTSGEKNRAKERCLLRVVYPALNSFLMQTLSFALINLHRCWRRE